MKLQKLPYTGKRAEMALAAMTLAYVLDAMFTVEAFCAYAKVPPNRHTRDLLISMCEEGILERRKRMNDSHRYPYHYEARQKRASLKVGRNVL